MTKVLRVALPILGAIAGSVFLPGVGTALGVAIGTSAGGAIGSVAGSLAANVILGKPKVAAASLANLDRLTASQVASAPRKMVFDNTAMATDLRYVEPSGTNQEYIDYIFHLASHRCTSVDQLWIEDKLAWTAAGGAQGIYVGYITVEIILEAGAAAHHTVNGGAKWGASQRLTGCCTMKVRIRRSGVDKKASSPLAGGLPLNIRPIGKGMPLYDPRRDSTVAGGSGPHRVANQATWQYADGAYELGQNVALQDLAYHIGWRINGVVSVGLGIPPALLDLAAYAAAANACDESVALAAGGTQRRYETAGVISDFDDPRSVTQMFADATNGWHDDSAGRLGFFVAVNDLTGALPVFDDDDVLSGGTWKPFPDAFVNIIRGRNPDPASPALYQPTDYPDVAVAALDGIDRAVQLDLPLVQDKRRAQRIAKQALQRLQYQGLFEATFGLRAWQLNRGQAIRLTFSALGWANKLFRVISMTFNADATVHLVLREESAVIYQWATDERPAVAPAVPVIYDPRNNPLAITQGQDIGVENGADLTGNHTSADTANVGGRPSATVLSDADYAKLKLAQLDADIAGNEAASGALIAQARAEAAAAKAEAEAAQTDADAAFQAALTEAATRGSEDTTIRSSITTLTGTVNGNAATFNDKIVVLTAADTALAGRATTLEANVAGNTSAIASQGVTLTTAISAVAAKTSTLTASLSMTMLSLNADFREWPDGTGTLPAYWNDWANGANPAVAQKGPAGTYDAQAGAGASQGLYQDFTSVGGGYFIVEVDAAVLAGNLSGAGILIRSLRADGTTVTDVPLHFPEQKNQGDTLNGAGGPGYTYRFRIFVFLPGDTNTVRVYQMTAWPGFGLVTAKSLRWVHCGVRQASSSEIAGQRADTNASSALARISTEETVSVTRDNALAASITTLTTTVSGNTAAINTEAITRSTQDDALAASVTLLRSDTVTAFGVRDANISNETIARTAQDSALAASIGTVSTRVDGNTATISSQQTSLNGLVARYSVTIDVNGYVSGWEANNNGSASDFTIRADRFRIGMPGGANDYPFQVIGGITYIQNAVIQDLSIGTAKVAPNAVTSQTAIAGYNILTYSGIEAQNGATITVAAPTGAPILVLATSVYAWETGGGVLQAVVYKQQGATGTYLDVYKNALTGMWIILDTPNAGTAVSYTLQFNRVTGSGFARASADQTLVALEIKR